MKKSLMFGVVMTAAAVASIVPALPAQALMGSGTDGCAVAGAVSSPWTSGPPHSIRACVGVDNAIQATGQVLNNSSGSN